MALNLKMIQQAISDKNKKAPEMGASAPMKDTITMNYAHPNETTARAESLRRATAELNKKAGKEVKYKILSQKMFRTKDGKYEGETILTQEED